MKDTSLITEDEFWAYEELRQFGAINMLDTSGVAEMLGLPIETCKTIRRNFSELKKKFNY